MNLAAKTSAEWQATAENERRLGLLILENKDGAELASGATHLRNAADAWAQAGWPGRQAECLLYVARLQRKRGQDLAAADASVQAVRILEGTNDTQQTCDAAMAAGRDYRAAADLVRAVRYAERALDLADTLNDHIRIATAQLSVGEIRLDQEDPAAAIEALNTALRIFTNYRKRLDVATCQQGLGRAHHHAGYYRPAEAAFEAAIATYDELGRRFEISHVLSCWTELEAGAKRWTRALGLLDRCREIHRETGNRELEGQVLRQRGSVELRQGDATAALESFEAALDLAIGLNDAEGQARSLYLLGSAYAEMDDSIEARSTLDRALVQAERQPNARITERILAALAKLQRGAGQRGQALQTMERWVSVLKDLGERHDALGVLGSMARLKLAGDDLDEAEEHLRRLLSVCTRPEDEAERLYANYGLGTVLVRRGLQRDAVPHFRTALDGYTDPSATVSPPVSLDRLHVQLGNCLLEQGQSDEAVIHFGAAEHLLAESSQRDDESAQGRLARALVGLGNAHSQLGSHQEAKGFFERAAELCEAQGDMRATKIIRRATDSLG